MADAVITCSEETFGSVKKIVWDWTAATDGSGTSQTTKAYTGQICSVTTIPDAVTAPSANYDVTITDQDSVDVLNGSGANKSATVTEIVTWQLGVNLGYVANDKLTFNLTNAGDQKKGKCILMIR
jgi:hypothetical protein